MGSPKSGGGRKRRSRGSDAASPLSHGSGGSGPQESEPARKRAKVNTAGTTSGSDEFDEGEIRDSSPGAQLPEADATTTAKPQVSQGGWNRAVGSGLRTSFGAATRLTPRKPQPDAEATSPDAEPTSPNVEPTSPDVEPSPVSEPGSEPVPEPEDDEMVVESSGANANPLLQDWVIPQDASFNNYHKKPYAKKGDTWESRLSRWLSVVALANQNNPGLQDPSVFLEVWHQWLNNQRPIDPNLKAIAIKSTTASALGPQKIGKMMEKAKRAIEPPKNAAPSVDLNLVDLSLPPRPPSVAMSLPPSVSMSLPPSVDLNLPPTVAVKDFAITKSNGGLLDNMFAGWLQAVVSLNTDITHYEDVTHYDEKTVDRLLENYRAWVASHVGVSEHKKTIAFKSAKNAIKPRGEKPKKVIVPQPPRLAQPPQLTRPPQLSRARELAAAANGLSEVGAIGHAFIAAHRHPASGNAVVATHGYTSLPDLPVIPPSREPYKALPREEELDCRASYWPFVKPEEVFCLVCTNRGHDSSACPLLICRWCEKKGHRFFVCPDRHRCAKCRQIGHQASCCTEKLVLPLDQMVCASCGDGDHLEDTCPEMFRDTFNPPPERIRKVKHLPIYCGCCGKEGHYWTECAMNEALVTAVHRAEYSTAKTMQYVDPDSENIAICYQNAPRPTSLGFQIRGAATEQQPNSTRKGLKLKLKLQHEELVRQLKIDKIERQRKIEYFADDDDDEPFVRPPVQSKQPAAGRITFSSFSTSNNAGGGNGGGGNRNGGGGGGGGRGGRGRGGQRNNDRGGGSMGDRRANPPLPPGPPPPSFGSGQNNHHGGGGGGGGNVRGGRGGAGGSRGRRGGSRGSRGGY